MRSGFLTSNNHWLINAKMRQVEIYRPNREVKILEYPKSLSGEDVLPGFVLDLQPIFERLLLKVFASSQISNPK